jgi:hypothetical protein
MAGIVIENKAQLATEVFDKYYKATGGISLWNDVNTYTVNQNFVSNAASDYQMEIKVSMPEMEMLKTKTIMKRNFIYGISPSDAFYKIPTGGAIYQVKNLSEKEKLNMQREVYDLFAPFYHFEARGYIATYVGLEAMGAQTVHHIELVNSDTKYDLYFNNSTDLLSKQKIRMASGEEITQEFTAYATAAFGIKYPSSGTYYSNIDKRNVRQTTNFVYNPVFDVGTFKR